MGGLPNPKDGVVVGAVEGVPNEKAPGVGCVVVAGVVAGVPKLKPVDPPVMNHSIERYKERMKKRIINQNNVKRWYA